MARLLEFLEGPAGELSSMRLMSTLWIMGILLVWIITSLKAGGPQDLPETVTWSLAAAFGGKVGQKAIEA